MSAINVFGSRLAFDARGAGEPVVALHPTACENSHWAGLAEHLQGSHCVFTPDLPGQGQSDRWPGAQRATIADEAETVFQLIDRWGEPVHLVGHGYGGAIALKIAMRHPQWIRSLTLVEPALFHVLNQSAPDGRRLLAEVRALEGCINAAAAEGKPELALAHFVDYWNGQGAWARTGQELKRRLVRTLPAVIGNLAASLQETWPLGAVSFVNCPVKLIRGEVSPESTRVITSMLGNALPNAVIETVAEAGHMLTRTHPHIVDPMISAHIEKCGDPLTGRRFAIAA